MIIASTYIAICLASMAGVLLFGAPKLTWLIPAAALIVAIVGVPHGGLDHWTGRRLLTPRFANKWWLMFFPTYLMVALGVASAWLAFPVATILLFFMASAWHFGREDDKSAPTRTALMSRSLFVHVNAMAVGGLAIWTPALLRPQEMQELLAVIIRANDVVAAEQIVLGTRWLACALVPWAAVVITMRIIDNYVDLRNWIPLATALLAATTPILLSFAIYFCAWHSIQALLDLKRHERLSHVKFIASVLPLSATAVIGMALGGWCLSHANNAFASDIHSIVLPTLFTGLAAIAVPHLLLHEMAEWQLSSQGSKGIKS